MSWRAKSSYFSNASSYRQNVASARRVVQNKPSALIHREESKVEFLARQFHSEKLSFVHKKEFELSFELSLSTCVFYRRIFNLEVQNVSLENDDMMTHASPFDFCEGGGYG